ncbi:MAG TPA: hypothetical protein VGX25_35360 [Actinophytocola sp.]|uniref:hypothetical protein n=1 Tax=Actinophytocola sp. TaxID=1872138 RepID=UPI002DDCEB74|nr:hypothetical protein [Actinophytocola sp.]HEV2784693.1 hypothetical protein [Actinophytocola sp.]
MPWAPDYVNLDDYLEYLRVQEIAVEDDTVLPGNITAAARAIDRHCNRQFGKVAAPEARYYTARWSKSKCGWRIWVDDFQTVAGLAVALDLAGDGSYATTVDLADVVKLPHNAAQEDKPWESLLLRGTSATRPTGATGEVRVTVQWGWSAIPVTATEANKLQASRLTARRTAPFGIAGSPESGTELRLLAKVDPDVAVMLEGYRRRRWAG